MQVLKAALLVIVVGCVVGWTTVSHATMMTIIKAENGSSGFGASLFHDTGGMGGSTVANITGASGTFTDGILTAILTLDGVITATVTTTQAFNFDDPLPAAGGVRRQQNTAELDITFSSPVGGLNTTSLWFTPGFQCCGKNYNDPNSLGPDVQNLYGLGSGDMLLTLWGTNHVNLGLDLRLSLTPVPEPGSMTLLGAGLLGLILLRRRLSVQSRSALTRHSRISGG